jgi:hypothetical protein
MKYFETKKGSLEEVISKAINEKPDSSSKPKELKEDVNAKELLEAGGKYLKYSDLLLQKGRLLAKNKNTAMIDREIDKEKKKLGIQDEEQDKLQEMAIVMTEAEGDKEKYQKFFRDALKKFGVESPADLEGAQKKKFFNYVDKNYKGDHEESVDLEEADAKVFLDVEKGNRDFNNFVRRNRLKTKVSHKNVNPGYDELEISGDKRAIEKLLKHHGSEDMVKFNPRTNTFEKNNANRTKLEEAIDKKSAQIILKHLKDKGSRIAQTQSSNLSYYLSRMDIQDIKKKGGKPPRGVGPEKEGRLEDLFDAMGVDIYTDGPSVIGKGNRRVGQWKDKTVADIIKMVRVRVEEVDLEEEDIKMTDQSFDSDKDKKDFFKFMKRRFNLSLKGKVTPGYLGGHPGAGSNFTLTGSDTNIKKYLRYLDDGGTTYLQIYKKKGNVYAAESVDLEKKLNDNVNETLDKIREANVEKQKSMRSILADIWNMNEGKNPFEKVKKEEKSSKKTLTGKKPTAVEIEPKVK